MANNNRKAFTPTETKPIPIRSQGPRRSWRASDETAPTWDSLPAELVAGIVRCITTHGGNPTFGYTRNGRALMLRVWYKGDSDVQYLTTADEVAQYVAFLAVEWFGIEETDLDYYGLGGPEKA